MAPKNKFFKRHKQSDGRSWVTLFSRRLPLSWGFPGGSSGKESACQCRRRKKSGFDPWVKKIPWMMAWQPTPVFLPGECLWTEEPGRLPFMELQRVGHKKQLSMHTHTPLSWCLSKGQPFLLAASRCSPFNRLFMIFKHQELSHDRLKVEKAQKDVLHLTEILPS